MRDLSPLRNRVQDLTKWLNENYPECFEEQKHLNAGAPERVYWHYGYMVAVRDALNYLTKSESFGVN